MWTIQKYNVGENKVRLLGEFTRRLCMVEVWLCAADWMFMKQEWNELKIEYVNIRNKINRIQKELSDECV